MNVDLFYAVSVNSKTSKLDPDLAVNKVNRIFNWTFDRIVEETINDLLQVQTAKEERTQNLNKLVTVKEKIGNIVIYEKHIYKN